MDPELTNHLKHLSINVSNLQKTEKSMAEMVNLLLMVKLVAIRAEFEMGL